MQTLALIVIMLFGLISDARTQIPRLDGEYWHRIPDEFYSVYNFHQDNFTLVEAGDLGKFFGKGKYQLKSNTLILIFDTLDIDRPRFRGYSIIEPKVDSLTVNAITKMKFEIVHTVDNGSRYTARYVKKRNHRK